MATLPSVKTGVSEIDLAAELTIHCYAAAPSPRWLSHPLSPVDQNSANPHAVPTERKLSPGDLLVMRLGRPGGMATSPT